MTRVGIITGLLFPFALLLSFGGCAGGTKGTGNSEVTGFKGQVLLDTGEPSPGANVTLLNTGVSAVSAADGTFSLESQVSGDVTFEVKQGETVGTITIAGVPAGSQVTFSINIRQEDHHVGLGEVEIDDSGRDGEDDVGDDHGGDSNSDDDINDDHGGSDIDDSPDDNGGSGSGDDSSGDDHGSDSGSSGHGSDDDGSDSGSSSSSDDGSGHGGRH
jgi:hypothetical protein